MEVRSLDLSTAIIYGDVPEDKYIYTHSLAGLTDADIPAILRLRKCLCGLPHAPNTFRKLSNLALRRLGFTPTVSDPRLYVRLNADGTEEHIAVHVDDFDIAAIDKTLIKQVVAHINVTYHVVEGDLDFYLGM